MSGLDEAQARGDQDRGVLIVVLAKAVLVDVGGLVSLGESLGIAALVVKRDRLVANVIADPKVFGTEAGAENGLGLGQRCVGGGEIAPFSEEATEHRERERIIRGVRLAASCVFVDGLLSRSKGLV